jgi:hypothetical protein
MTILAMNSEVIMNNPKSLYSAMVIAAIFLFTRPPAINELDDLTLIAVGLLSFVCLGFLAISEVYTRFIK